MGVFDDIVKPIGAGNLSSPLLIGRVKDIIMDDKHPEFAKYGGWASLGFIKFSPVYQTSDPDSTTSLPFAKPISSNYSQFPLLEEIVLVISGPSTKLTSDPNAKDYFYISVFNFWNSTHHNGFPDLNNASKLPDAVKKDYLTIAEGSIRKIRDNSSDLALGSTFKEKSNIRNIVAYEGDVIMQGRFGQSIRFGSTVKKSPIPNFWSAGGNETNEGDPITIIRNGQNKALVGEGWVPILEDINSDGASIYLCSGQEINIQLASTNLNSFGAQLQTPVQSTLQLSDYPIGAEIPLNESDNSSLSVAQLTDKLLQTPTSGSATPSNPASTVNPSISTTPTGTSNIPPTGLEAGSKNNPIGEEDLVPGEIEEFQSDFQYSELDKEEQKAIEAPDYSSSGESENNLAKDGIYYYDVPREKQINTTACFIASCTMILRYLKISVSQNYILQNYNKDGLLDSSRLFTKEAKRTIYTKTISGGSTGYKQVVDFIKSTGKPFILCKKSIGSKGQNGTHFIVVKGLNSKGEVLLNDPANNKVSSVDTVLKVSDLLDGTGTAKGSIRYYS
jgi:hypothetical protein